MILDNKPSAEYIVKRLEENKRTCYIRYGDGDFIAMYPQSLNTQVGRCNKSFISEDIQEWLKHSYSINKEDYLVGTLQDIRHPRSTLPNIDFNIINSMGLTHPETLYSAIALQEAFLDYPEVFKKFLDCLRKKRSVYVNWYFEPVLQDYLGEVAHWIPITQYNAVSDQHTITQKIIDLDPNSFDQILLSAGQLSRVMMSRLYEFFKDKDIIDLGSCSDKLIYGTESFRHIMVRGHIDNNRPLIEERLRYFK